MQTIKNQIHDNRIILSDDNYEQTGLRLWLHLRVVIKDHLQDHLWSTLRDPIWIQLKVDEFNG
jgi:hypothetical protein